MAHVSMTSATAMLAVDLGAQSGRVTLGSFDGRLLRVAEVHRFPNDPVRLSDRLHWDVLGLHGGVLAGMRAARRAADGHEIRSVAVDAWGVDYALLDRAGRLVQNPVHHRDPRTDAAMTEVHNRIGSRQLYERTGVQMMPVNTLYQLWAMAADDDPALDAAGSLLMIPDLFHYWLCGARGCELTTVTTTQCFDLARPGGPGRSSIPLGLPRRLFGEVVPPATVLGSLGTGVAEETGLTGTLVVAAAGHDTAAAVAAVPFRQPESAYISSGTWSLVGVEIPAPLINDSTFAANLTNEGGVEGTFRLLRNVTGLWLLQECRRVWSLDGAAPQFGELAVLAETAPRLGSFIDPNDAEFLAPGDMPARIRAYCASTGQPVPDGVAAVTRCILESLSLKYRHTIELIANASGCAPREVHVVGGGALNRQLCQWTADATGLPVLAGPTEASSVGNLIAQLMALGELGSLADGREVVRASYPLEVYEPRDRDDWEAAFGRFCEIAAPRISAS